MTSQSKWWFPHLACVDEITFYPREASSEEHVVESIRSIKSYLLKPDFQTELARREEHVYKDLHEALEPAGLKGLVDLPPLEALRSDAKVWYTRLGELGNHEAVRALVLADCKSTYHPELGPIRKRPTLSKVRAVAWLASGLASLLLVRELVSRGEQEAALILLLRAAGQLWDATNIRAFVQGDENRSKRAIWDETMVAHREPLRGRTSRYPDEVIQECGEEVDRRIQANPTRKPDAITAEVLEAKKVCLSVRTFQKRRRELSGRV
ncbi:MAG: hypothetical protein M5U13_13555 [Thermoanaerobaculia bacterium]|nr:hypothetical protein [Thermoanaerobaculia bacterium]